jgi:spoIIIJ-associated protein
MKEPEIDLSGIEAKETDATNYLKSILIGMGFSDANVTVKETEEDLFFEITCGEDYGNIIGRRGETLDALQYLTRLYVNRADKDGKRVALNVGDYRKRREETLKSLAKRQAQRAIKYRRSCVLEPMNPYERRIIHTAIQEISGVSSHSVGEGENRRVVIVSDDCDNQKRGGYSRDRRNNNGGRRERRPQYVPETPKEPREQKVDATGSSRYGKIEPKHTQGE